MNIAKYVSQFFYRIRYWLLWGSLIVTALVIYFTQFLPYSYTVESSLYVGVTSATNIDGTTVSSYTATTTFENLISIAESRATHKKVSLRLLAAALTYGEEWKDNRYIQARHYRQLIQDMPQEVLELADRKDVNKTLANITDYQNKSTHNYVYELFDSRKPFFSARALDDILAERLGDSDVLRLEYTSSDPGLTQLTVEYLLDELLDMYEILRFKATRDVIAYFEEQVRLAKEKLTEEEDKLMHYCVQERVINYNEETEALSLTRYEVDDRMENAMRQYEGAVALLGMLEDKMDIRADIIRNNTALLRELDKISDLNQRITEQEIFLSDDKEHKQLDKDREDLAKTENKIQHIADELNSFNFSKEGVGIQDMVSQWLQALVDRARYGAEIEVLKDRQQDIINQYIHMSPVGTQVNRMERAIGIAEDNYRNQIRGLSEAYLRLKNIEMNTNNLQVVTPPEYPLTDNGRDRWLYVLLAFLGSLLFITLFFLLIELLDRTLRDAFRSERLTGLPVMAAFNGVSNLKYRGFLKACNRIAAAYCCRRLNQYLVQGRPTVINLLSMEPREGKSYLARYFANYWEEEGMKVRTVEAGEDFQFMDNNSYINATQLADFWQLNAAEETPDILLVEYPAIHNASVPVPVLKQGDVNLLIANACRLWRTSDDTTIAPLKAALKDVPFFLYLNNAGREVVEAFTGELPPQTPVHSFFSKLAQLGLTAKKPAVR